MNAGQIIDVFDRCFGERYLTRLCGGAEEPLYLPAVGEQPAQLFFRADYAASALHEAAPVSYTHLTLPTKDSV